MKDLGIPTVSVIGYIGSGIGRVHVGKSCLIHRFLSKTPYCEDQLSVISHSEFDGEVVGGEHWLYWGEANLQVGVRPISLRIVEHCEFVDDHLFLPISVTIPYSHRCLSRELHVRCRKLAYVCKAQLSDEASFSSVYLLPGKVRISVFLFVYDTTLCGTAASQQACFLQHVLRELCSNNFPLVIATSKCDTEASPEALTYLEESLGSAKKRWIKRRFAIVETSAKLNVNVLTPFQYAGLLSYGLLPEIKPGRKSHVSKLDQHLGRLTFKSKTTSHQINDRQVCLNVSGIFTYVASSRVVKFSSGFWWSLEHRIEVRVYPLDCFRRPLYAYLLYGTLSQCTLVAEPPSQYFSATSVYSVPSSGMVSSPETNGTYCPLPRVAACSLDCTSTLRFISSDVAYPSGASASFKYNGFHNGPTRPGLSPSYFIDPADSYSVAYAEQQRKQQHQNGNNLTANVRFQVARSQLSHLNVKFTVVEKDEEHTFRYHVYIVMVAHEAQQAAYINTEGIQCTSKSCSRPARFSVQLLRMLKWSGFQGLKTYFDMFRAVTEDEHTEPTAEHDAERTNLSVNGDLYRVWILAASSVCSTSTELDRFAHNEGFSSNRSLSPVDRPFFMSVPPEPTFLSKSHVSAFSAPSNSPNDENGVDGAGLRDSQTTQTSLPSTSASESMHSNEAAELEGSHSSEHSAVHQLCLHLLVYSSLVELERHAVNRVAFEFSYHVIGCFPPTNLVDTNMVDLLSNGLILSSQWNLPFLNSDNPVNPDLLKHLLSLACKVSTDSESPCAQSINLDWTAFGLSDSLLAILRVLLLRSNVTPTATFSTCTDPTVPRCHTILGAIMSLPDQTTTTTAVTTSTREVPTLSNARPNGFLPVNITSPAAIKPKLNAMNLVSVAPRFFYLHQLSQILKDESMAFPKTSAVSRILFIHYLTSAWSCVEPDLRDTLDNLLLASTSPSDLTNDSQSTGSGIKAIILVAIHEPVPLEEGPNEAVAINAGFECMKQIAMKYQCSVRIVAETPQIQGDGIKRVQSSSLADPPRTSDKPQLLFIPVSSSDGFEKVIYRLALESESSLCSPVLGSSTNFRQATRESLYSSVPTLIDNPCNYNVNMNTPPHPPTIGFPHSVYQPITIASRPAAVRTATVNSPNSLNLWSYSSPTIGQCSPSGQRIPKSNMVALPWLPLSPADALRLSNCKRSAYFTHRLPVPRPPNPLSQSPSKQSQAPALARSFNGPTSGPLSGGTVEEYYAELPKVPQRDPRITHNHTDSTCDVPSPTNYNPASAFDSLISVLRRPTWWFRKNRQQIILLSVTVQLFRSVCKCSSRVYPDITEHTPFLVFSPYSCQKLTEQSQQKCFYPDIRYHLRPTSTHFFERTRMLGGIDVWLYTQS
ncbi:Rho GTPase-activating protein 190 [Clonorchis sinensis]|uniref:Rho GTPase-activating protein 190 n=1 Tax=Clonorchis sinensis TaxID=79923 RepID=H2KP12_CLOSI|nr:Rho GTPase-activating protein 190 [Clonorchis sinensis]